jgi:hypothetical protein
MWVYNKDRRNGKRGYRFVDPLQKFQKVRFTQECYRPITSGTTIKGLRKQTVIPYFSADKIL